MNLQKKIIITILLMVFVSIEIVNIHLGSIRDTMSKTTFSNMIALANESSDTIYTWHIYECYVFGSGKIKIGGQIVLVNGSFVFEGGIYSTPGGDKPYRFTECSSLSEWI